MGDSANSGDHHVIAPTDIEVRDPIYVVRAKHVMLDTDLAALCVVETGALDWAAKRNENSFPGDLKCQNGISKGG